MPLFDYKCNKCETIVEVFRDINAEGPQLCETCNSEMEKQFSASFNIINGSNGSIESHKEREHRKKVKDFDRAVKARKKMFGSSEVGQPVDKPDQRHIIRKKPIGTQGVEVNRQDFIKAAAQNNKIVDLAQKALKKK